VYVPELIFGHLLTSSNYDDDEKKVRSALPGSWRLFSMLYASVQPWHNVSVVSCKSCSCLSP
jgi:hypothetical protein